MNYDRIQFITGFVLTSMTRFTPFGKMRKAISFNHMIKSRPIEKMLSGKDELLKKMLKLSRSGWGGRAGLLPLLFAAVICRSLSIPTFCTEKSYYRVS